MHRIALCNSATTRFSEREKNYLYPDQNFEKDIAKRSDQAFQKELGLNFHNHPKNLKSTQQSSRNLDFKILTFRKFSKIREILCRFQRKNHQKVFISIGFVRISQFSRIWSILRCPHFFFPSRYRSPLDPRLYWLVFPHLMEIHNDQIFCFYGFFFSRLFLDFSNFTGLKIDSKLTQKLEFSRKFTNSDHFSVSVRHQINQNVHKYSKFQKNKKLSHHEAP